MFSQRPMMGAPGAGPKMLPMMQQPSLGGAQTNPLRSQIAMQMTGAQQPSMGTPMQTGQRRMLPIARGMGGLVR